MPPAQPIPDVRHDGSMLTARSAGVQAVVTTQLDESLSIRFGLSPAAAAHLNTRVAELVAINAGEDVADGDASLPPVVAYREAKAKIASFDAAAAIEREALHLDLRAAEEEQSRATVTPDAPDTADRLRAAGDRIDAIRRKLADIPARRARVVAAADALRPAAVIALTAASLSRGRDRLAECRDGIGEALTTITEAAAAAVADLLVYQRAGAALEKLANLARNHAETSL